VVGSRCGSRALTRLADNGTVGCGFLHRVSWWPQAGFGVIGSGAGRDRRAALVADGFPNADSGVSPEHCAASGTALTPTR
jgi:hypothetical protein